MGLKSMFRPEHLSPSFTTMNKFILLTCQYSRYLSSLHVVLTKSIQIFPTFTGVARVSSAVNPELSSTTIKSTGVRGSENRKTAQKYAKKPQTASDFFPNTETARTCRPQYESWRQQDFWFLITLCVSIKHTIITLTIYCTTLLYSIYY